MPARLLAGPAVRPAPACRVARPWARALLLLVILVSTAIAPAQTTQPDRASAASPVARSSTSRPAPSPANAAFDWQRLVIAMSVVLTLIFLLRYVAGRAFPGLVAGKGSRAVRVLSRSALAPKQQLMLVQVGRRVIVIGDSAGELTSLSEITDPDEVASLLGQLDSAEPAAPARPFAHLFGHAREQYAEPTESIAPAEPPARRRDDSNIEPIGAGEELEQTQSEISGLIDRMRSLTKTMRQ
ncbi:MAG TPA: flagellar biosynthetic protein FliO [Tepidisphaeraceae bacterium]